MNIKQTSRILFRNKKYSILNIAGLAIGIACAALILLWVEDELTYNKFPKQKQLYALYRNLSFSDEIKTEMGVPNPLTVVLKEEVPGIRNLTRHMGSNSLFTLNEKMIYERGLLADVSFFDMFDIQFIRGNASTAFDAAYPIVISEQMAERFFGKNDPVGQTLKRNNEQEFTVTAVINNLEKNSYFGDFSSWVIPFQQVENEYSANGYQDMVVKSWTVHWVTIFVELEASADVSQINHQIRDLVKQKRNSAEETTTLFLYPISKLKLYGEFKDGYPTGTGYVRYVRLFFWIAVVILVIACINFMNLSTARSQKRVLEVGVRKTFGAKRMRLIRQFMFESGIITLISLALAIVLIAVALPSFNMLTGKHLTMGLGNPVNWLGLLCIGLICSIMAGSYPAFFLSSFPPIDVLNKLKAGSGSGVVLLRQGLVVFQFTVSLTLIICTAFIYLQVRHAQNRPLGMNIQQVISLNTNQDIRNRFEPLKHELLATGVVENVGLCSDDMLDFGGSNWGWNWQGKPDDFELLVNPIRITDELFPTLQITMYDGRNFERGIDANSRNIIINKAFADIIGEEGLADRRIWRGNNKENASVIIGIINDFVSNDVYTMAQKPVYFTTAKTDEFGHYLYIRLKHGDIQSSLQTVEAVVKRFDPNRPFEYKFMDEEFGRKFKSNLLVGKLAGLFAALAIFISCLGLYGLIAFSAEQRTREIGIRKVLGATVWDIVVLLGRNFILLTAISIVTAIPLAYWMMYQWLQSYEYRIGMSWWVFAASGMLVIMIAMFTVSFQAIKAAMANPVEAIKSK